ncbi:hypothetical protein VIVU109783_02270 [Vibrio vulnificus]
MTRRVSIDARSKLAEHAIHCFQHKKILCYEGYRYFVKKCEIKGAGRATRLWLELEAPL